jgi:type VI secretion system secreted protein VgrG
MKIKGLISFTAEMLVAVICLPFSAIAQSILGSAGNFTILGGAAVTSSGAVGTIITTGDVGSAAAVTGFPPAALTGGASVTTDTAVVSPALADLVTVAHALAVMPSNTDLTSMDLGGMTLLPGVYTFTSTAALAGTLTLNANFQNNAFWVFQIGTALNTTTNSNVTLINPGTNMAMDDGIYWDAGSAISIGANNQILGNYLAATSITFGDEVNGSGRALAQAGVTLATTVLNSHGGPGNSDWTSGLVFNAMGNVVPVPEPAAFLWLMPLSAVGFAFWRRQLVVNKAPGA